MLRLRKRKGMQGLVRGLQHPCAEGVSGFAGRSAGDRVFAILDVYGSAFVCHGAEGAVC
jgi:hypothetical protein